MRNLLRTPSKQQVDCHEPKPVLLDAGEMNEPYDWAVSDKSSPVFVSTIMTLKYFLGIQVVI